MSENRPESGQSRRRDIALPEDPEERVNLFRSLYERVVLSGKLFVDSRVSFMAKLIPIGSVLYFFSPFDFIPEALLVALGPAVAVGVVDDLALIVIALNLFIQVAPSDVVKEHLREMGARIGYQFEDDDTIIDGEADIIE